MVAWHMVLALLANQKGSAVVAALVAQGKSTQLELPMGVRILGMELCLVHLRLASRSPSAAVAPRKGRCHRKRMVPMVALHTEVRILVHMAVHMLLLLHMEAVLWHMEAVHMEALVMVVFQVAGEGRVFARRHESFMIAVNGSAQ